MNDPDSTKMYGELASWWPLLSAPADYAEEAAFFQQALLSACSGSAHTLLELGSGGGNNASHLKSRFDMTLVDASPGMLDVSRGLNPDCEHLLGDMRTLRLDRQFDCVFVHDAIAYMTSEEDLRRALETAFVHCRPGGGAIFAPDHLSENFAPETEHGGHDEPGEGPRRGLRYLSWMWDPDPSDNTYIVDYAYMMRDRDGTTRVEYDRHVEGLFPRADWLRLLSAVGFEAEARPFEHSEIEPGNHEIFLARCPI